MYKFITILIVLLWSNVVIANEIYIEQVGDTLDLDITQDGTDNEFGDSTADAVLIGDDMTFAITQTGNLNKIDATIKGNNYTGTWTFTGNSNDVELTCAKAGGVNCEDVTLNITTTGDDNTYDIFIGENADAEDLEASFTVTGDNNIFINNIDGEGVKVVVTVDNSASNVATSANSDEGNKITLDIDGNGNANGHEVLLDITGGGGTVDITQSGVGDNKVDLDITGESFDIDISQTD